MRVVIRGRLKTLRSSTPFAFSACVHGGVLALVVFGGSPAEPRRASLYDQEIRPNENKIVWYRFTDKLPEIAPPEARDKRPPRARTRAPQTMVAGIKDEETPAPMIWTPEPVPQVPKPLALPNVIAVAAPKLLRPFVAPPDVHRESAAALPEPPAVESKIEAKPLPIDLKGPKPAPRAFVPPPDVRMARQAAIVLPEAPETRATVVEAGALPFAPGGARPRPRDFVPPPEKKVAERPLALPAAPEVASAVANVRAIALPRTFVPPPARPQRTGEPTVSVEAPRLPAETPAMAETTLAIVGLNPTNTRVVNPPAGSRPAGFSAGPVVRKDGGDGSKGSPASLAVPGLTVSGGVKDDRAALLAVLAAPTAKENLRAAMNAPGAVRPKAPAEAATRITEAPDPRLAGRVVYTVAIQMPNITSYSGSWIVWFAERAPVPGAGAVNMRAPEPLRKVDPKYVASAVADRVEGKVRLAAVIRKDGRVEEISVVRGLDARLDRTAAEALAKWEFTAAMRNGVAVDVDAVFEIPFHLAPRAAK